MKAKIKNADITSKFLGIFPPNTTYEKNHLKAYLKGHEYFHYGKDNEGYPIRYKVEREITLRNQNNK